MIYFIIAENRLYKPHDERITCAHAVRDATDAFCIGSNVAQLVGGRGAVVAPGAHYCASRPGTDGPDCLTHAHAWRFLDVVIMEAQICSDPWRQWRRLAGKDGASRARAKWLEDCLPSTPTISTRPSGATAWRHRRVPPSEYSKRRLAGEMKL